MYLVCVTENSQLIIEPTNLILYSNETDMDNHYNRRQVW